MATFRARYDGTVIVPEEPVDLPVGETMTFEARAAGVSFEEYICLPIEERIEGLRNATGARLAPPDPNSNWPREELYSAMGPSELPFDEWERRFDALPRLECGPDLPAEALRREISH
jgi:hypothetical protein